MPCWGAAMDGPTLMVMGERIGEVPPVDGVASVMIGVSMCCRLAMTRYLEGWG